MSAWPRVTVIVPCRNEARYLDACLDSLLDGRYPADRLEVLVVDGRSDDGSREIAAARAARHPAVRVLDNPARVVPAALNLGIRAASGEVIARADAHVVDPPDYLTRLAGALRDSGADNVGGRLETLPAHDGPVARAIALALSHPLGVGNAHFRIGTARPRWVDTVPFGCYRRDVFSRIGLFDEELVRNQDDEFNLRLLRRGGRLLLLPDVVARYFARGSYRQVARMFYQYGLFKPLVARKVGRIMTARQLVPPAFVALLAGGAALALAWPPARAPWTLLLVAYAAVVLAAAASAARAHGLRCAAALAATFPVLHLSYGFGFLRGLWGLLTDRGRRPRDPAAVPLSR
ncbi:MAG TPA: glycosyltransferase family 2 protein [Gemmatimonadales bacterium]|nr:glycosyltransferase family 2 protein [Gemmatimonadales bacterium]